MSTTETADRTLQRPGGRPPVFRVFVSSTFRDLEAERNLLREQVYPELARFCAERGARFQAIDLRWGVSEDASLDQQAMSICLGEIQRCREITPRPNFLILLGNRYGWLALPPQIPETEFVRIREAIADHDDDLAFLERWYQLDRNAVPSEYRLRPRAGPWAPPEHQAGASFGDEPSRAAEELRRWEIADERLRTILTVAVQHLDLPDERRSKYLASATEQEIRAGALEIGAPEGRAFCFLREIELTDHDPDPRSAGADAPIRWFVDPDEVGPRSGPLHSLKQELADRLPGGRYRARWSGDAPTTDHLQQLRDDVLTTLERAIETELEHPTEPAIVETKVKIQPDDLLDGEGRAHTSFANDRIVHFVGRSGVLDRIDNYLDASDRQPLVVHGEGGTGKSALMGEAIRRALAAQGDGHLLYRFIGATPGSADGRTLLEGMCRELARRAGTDESDVPNDFQQLSADFRGRLGSAATPDRPLVVFIDSLDQLSAGHAARRLTWLPSQLPDHVRLVVSTRPGETFEPFRQRLERLDTADHLVELGPMSRVDGDELLALWLADVGRTLTDTQRDAVLDAFDAADGNPLYLRLAFEEARRWISEQPPETLAVDDATDGKRQRPVEAIIEHNTFARLASEDNHGRVLVSHALGYLAASRYGLAEDELLDLLSRDPGVYSSFLLGSYHIPPDFRACLDAHLPADAKAELRNQALERNPASRQADEIAEWVRQIRDGERCHDELTGLIADVNSWPVEAGTHRGVLRLPVVLWSRLFADLRPYLTETINENSVVIDYFHRELDDVARAVYLADDSALTLHHRIADYFRAKADPYGDHTWTTDGETVDRRGLSELPYHLTQSQRWDELFDTLTDFVFLEQKVEKVAVAPGADGEKPVYRGVFALQDDFDTALKAMGGEGDDQRRRIIVTAVDLGNGLEIRCPHCNRMIPWKEAYRGTEMPCPHEGCGGPMKVNPFVVGDGIDGE